MIVRLLEALSSNCRAIIGPSTSPNALCCGDDVTTKIGIAGRLTQSSYCAEHHARFHWQPGQRMATRPRSRACDICGKSFLPKNYQSASCSDECRLQKKKEAGKAYKRLKTAAKQASDGRRA